MKSFGAILGLVTAVVFSPAALADHSVLSPYQAEYTLRAKGLNIGEATRRLTINDNKVQLETRSESTGAIGLFLKFNQMERSTLTLVDKKPTPDDYIMSRSKRGKKTIRKMHFDHNAGLLEIDIESNRKTVPLEKELYDQQSYQLALRMDLQAGKTELTYPIYRKGQKVEYTFKIIGEETLDTVAGKFKTIHLSRKIKNRQTEIWVAKDYNYILVKITKSKNDSQIADLELTKFTYLDSKHKLKVK